MSAPSTAHQRNAEPAETAENAVSAHSAGSASARAPAPNLRVRRLPERGAYDRATIDAILDEGLVAHVGFVHDGAPVVIPTGYVRDGDRLLLHGSRASGMMRALAGGQPVCVTVTLLDGLVLAKSGFNHSMNYRSVVVHGRATPVPDADKEAALRAYMERLLPGRWDALRPTTADELAGTAVAALPLDAASAKVRTGPPKDEAGDLAWPVWSGVLPLTTHVGPPVADAPTAAAGHPVPGHVAGWSGTWPRQRR